MKRTLSFFTAVITLALKAVDIYSRIYLEQALPQVPIRQDEENIPKSDNMKKIFPNQIKALKIDDEHDPWSTNSPYLQFSIISLVLKRKLRYLNMLFIYPSMCRSCVYKIKYLCNLLPEGSRHACQQSI